MALSGENFDERFRDYRMALRDEFGSFVDAAAASRQVIDCAFEGWTAELNLAPGFFNTAREALRTFVIIWADKLFDPAGERGVFNFLKFVENNRRWLTEDEFKRRRSAWSAAPSVSYRAVTYELIEEHRTSIRSFAPLANIRKWRDGYHAHFDKEYFSLDDRSRLEEEARLTRNDLDALKHLMVEIINAHSLAFDGTSYIFQPGNGIDLRPLLATARQGIAGIPNAQSRPR